MNKSLLLYIVSVFSQIAYWLIFSMCVINENKMLDVGVYMHETPEFTVFQRNITYFVLAGLLIPIVMIISSTLIYKRKINFHEIDDYMGIPYVIMFIISILFTLIFGILMIPMSMHR